MARTPATSRSRRLAFAVLVALLALLAFAGAAFADALTPESGGSPNADEIDSLYWLVFGVALVIFVGVEGALFYSLIKFRARKGAVAAQIRGNTRLEIGWTVGAALILVVLAVFTFAKLREHPATRRTPAPNGLQLADSGTLVASGPTKKLPPNGRSLNICVNGQQYIWRYTYASDCDNAPLELAVLLRADGRPGRHDGDARHPRPGRRALLVDPEARRQVRRHPGLHELHLVQDPGQARRHGLHRPVRRALRAQPREHDRHASARSRRAEFEQWLDQRKADIKAADAGRRRRSASKSSKPASCR